MKATAFCASLVVLLAVGAPAFAGMGAVRPTYHAKPCEGGDCRGDDDRSGMPCQGLLCTFSSAKALQKPVTASEAAEMQTKAASAEAQAKGSAPPAEAPVPDAKKKKKKTAAKHPKPAPVAEAEAPKSDAPQR